MMLKIQELREAPAKFFFGFRPESFKWEQESDKVSDAQKNKKKLDCSEKHYSQL